MDNEKTHTLPMADEYAGKDTRSSDGKDAEILTRIIDGLTFIHGAANTGRYVVVTEGSTTRTLDIAGKAFDGWLKRSFKKVKGVFPGKRTIEDAIAMCDAEADAIPRKDRRPVFTRVGLTGTYGANAKHYLYLGEGRYTETTEDGWEVKADTCPVVFREPADYVPLPDPVHAATKEESLRDFQSLRKQLNLASEDDWHLIQAWMVITALPKLDGYPLFNFTGSEDSAKSSMQNKICGIIDPANEDDDESEMGNQSDDLRDLLTALADNWITAIGNVSKINAEQSDALCKVVVKGYKRAEREFYTNGGLYKRTIFKPVCTGGITDYFRRPDMISRVWPLQVPSISEEVRKSFKAGLMRKEYLSDRPRITGAVLDAVSHVLKHYREAEATADNFSRFDSANIIVAVLEDYFGWTRGHIATVLKPRMKAASSVALDSLPWLTAIKAFLNTHGGHWEGRSSDFYVELTAAYPRREYSIPGSSSWLINELNRVKAILPNAGIKFEHKVDRDASYVVFDLITVEAPDSEEVEWYGIFKHNLDEFCKLSVSEMIKSSGWKPSELKEASCGSHGSVCDLSTPEGPAEGGIGGPAVKKSDEDDEDEEEEKYVI